MICIGNAEQEIRCIHSCDVDDITTFDAPICDDTPVGRESLIGQGLFECRLQSSDFDELFKIVIVRLQDPVLLRELIPACLLRDTSLNGAFHGKTRQMIRPFVEPALKQ